MQRRHFLQAAAGFALCRKLPAASSWQTYEITTRVEVLKPVGVTRIWVPSALSTATPYQRTISNTFEGPARKFDNVIAAEFAADVKPVLKVTSVIETRDWAGGPPAALDDPKQWLRATRLIPTDGIVRETALKITKGAASDQAKARAIYEWIVENTHREPKVRGCGLGNIRFMLESGDLGGKCADLNSLYVGLARSVGLPARDAYGIRVAKSELGYKSLGAASATITKSQHCRAEVYLTGQGWTPVDPADVRKVMLEEPAMTDQARQRLFGSWEMNWMAYNFDHDVQLPGSTGPAIPFFMYPQAETAEGRLDSLDPDSFRYEITASLRP
jgi:transglutaminase-like putative cysteine protease